MLSSTNPLFMLVELLRINRLAIFAIYFCFVLMFSCVQAKIPLPSSNSVKRAGETTEVDETLLPDDDMSSCMNEPMNEAVIEVMERVCATCHDFGNRHDSNIRAKCRANCFKSEVFKDCVSIFTAKRHTRHIRSRKFF